jgi:hypothetical protein
VFFDIKPEKQSHIQCVRQAFASYNLDHFQINKNMKTAIKNYNEYYRCPASGAVSKVQSTGFCRYAVTTCTISPAIIMALNTNNPTCFYGWDSCSQDAYEAVKAETLNTLGLMDACALHEQQIAEWEAQEADKYACLDFTCFEL